jgi:thiamine transport system ATP-binding protein
MLDEPLSALDSGLREHLVEVLAAGLRATATPALYVTHDQDEAFTIADRVAVLGRGRLLQVAAPAQLWRRPASREVAEFLGYGPFLTPAEVDALGWPGPLPRAVVALGPDGLVLDAGGVELPVSAAVVGRGQTDLEVQLPGGQSATVRIKGVAERPSLVRVRVNPEGCAPLAAR